ncbi:HPF/RaiA family ribosome-associated protein [Saccharothrix longispora]|uniref:HPF/RaiA family ribosome-associated protein n=1 Tax=Saccharothrix longispora TaxID=33920 RepID=UPI0028FD7876|nr:HPF/RaiA family ribosome-associated protein [Saccharothrix longispora]MBY8850872.1 HPF/RaiA family ribosome-associated protein [Saccharothrix sp. MB29]MDU0287781.1 HPF/RaiA family ribosome-associated protein [Saccharothrix longispora]
MQDTPEGEATIAQRLRLGTGFLASEHDWIAERLASLGSRLRSFRDDQVDLEISLKDRDGAEQRVTLECWINRTPRLHLVATSTERDLAAALGEVRNELVRQVDEAKTRTEPRNNRALRAVPELPELG